MGPVSSEEMDRQDRPADTNQKAKSREVQGNVWRRQRKSDHPRREAYDRP